MALAQDTLNNQNMAFWNTLCGTNLAQHIGINDASPESLKKFDDWYFGYYPYLAKHIPFAKMRNRRVLEVGLGYGTVSQRIAEAGADYIGLDIAEGPVDMVNHRLRCLGRGETARQGNILAAPFADYSFDYIVAIGCYHHTGNLQRALDESYRMLRPYGLLVAMVYNCYSYRRWLQETKSTLNYLIWDWARIGASPLAKERERMKYDADRCGNAAPHTDFVSRHHLQQMCGDFDSFHAALENIAQEPPFSKRSRPEIMNTKWPAWVGLDIYFQAQK